MAEKGSKGYQSKEHPTTKIITINFEHLLMAISRNVSDEEITTAMTVGITFKGAKLRKPTEVKVKTKAKKKTYITGQHGSGAAKKKAEIRQRRANRHKGK